MLKQIFAANQGARDKVSAILTEIQNKQKQMTPEMGDPASVTAFGQFLDQKFAEIQQVLTDAQVDAKTQAAILDALGDEYRNNGPDAPGGGDTAGGNGSRLWSRTSVPMVSRNSVNRAVSKPRGIPPIRPTR